VSIFINVYLIYKWYAFCMSHYDKLHHPVDHIPPQRVPSAISTARRLFHEAARAKGHALTLRFGKNSYRPIDEISGTETQPGLAFGSLDGAKASLSDEQRRQVVEISGWLASLGKLTMRRFDLASESFAPVEVEMQAAPLPGLLAYLPQQNLRRKDTTNAFTTAAWLAHKCGAFVSFVGYTDEEPVYDACATAVEIVQNRLQVAAVTTDDGRRYTSDKMTHPYQEVVANSIGEMCGMVAAGLDFKSYNQTMRSIAPIMFRADSDHISLLAPQHIFAKDTYEQIANGDIPTEAPRILPLYPGLTIEQ